MECNDPVAAERVYQRAMEIVPHKIFTFAKLWIMMAHYYVRCLNLEKARKIFGKAIGQFNNEKIYKAYIDLGMQIKIKFRVAIGECGPLQKTLRSVYF